MLMPMPSSYIPTYPSSYRGPKPIINQVEDLAKILCLDPAQALCYAKQLPPLPAHAEGWFAIPSPSALQARFSALNSYKLHCSSTKLILGILHDLPGHSLAKNPEISPNFLRRSPRTRKALSLLRHDQPGDILIVAAQLGLRHRGRSASAVREALLPTEYGLDTVAVGSIILTNPHRIGRWSDLAMVCAGDIPLKNYGPISSIETICFVSNGFFFRLAFWYFPDEWPGRRGAVTAFMPAGSPSFRQYTNSQ